MNTTTTIVVKRHIDALMARNLDKLMDDYSDDVLFISNMSPETIRGKEAVRQFWTQAFFIFTPELLSNLKFTQQIIEQDIAYFIWSAGTSIPFGSDTFVVRDGKIVEQTAAVQIVQ